MKTIEFEGKKIKYDQAALGKWSVVRGLSSPQSDADFYAAVDKLFGGKTEEVAAALDDSIDSISSCVRAIFDKENEAKNSQVS